MLIRAAIPVLLAATCPPACELPTASTPSQLAAQQAHAATVQPGSQPVPQAAPPSSSLDLIGSGDTVTLPIQVTRGYIFLEGDVAGESGVFMFDSGSPFPFFLNNHLLPLDMSKPSGSGAAASGQELTLYTHDGIGSVTLAGHEIANPGQVRSADFHFIETGIRPDFLGFVGLPLVKDFEFRINYDQGTLRLFRLTDAGDPVVPHVDSEDVVATITLSEDRPVAVFQLDGVAISGSFDTGSPGGLTLTSDTRKALRASGRLPAGEHSSKLEGLSYNGVPLAAETGGVRSGDEDAISMGFNLLAHYVSVWNLRKGTITLLRRTPPEASNKALQTDRAAPGG